MAIPNQITLTGDVYIKYFDHINSPKIGDILLLLHDDAISDTAGAYEDTSMSGYFKTKVYDGKIWQHVDINEFCYNKENRFAKRQKPIDSALLCQEILATHKGKLLYRTYRGHFTTEEYQQTPYIRKAKYAKQEP